MPLFYGEGDKSFLRLQLEIIKQNDDESIFAWTSDDTTNSGMLATTPSMFAGSKGVSIDRGVVSRPPFSMTNTGPQFPVKMHKWDHNHKGC
jgi:hypothetical protein